MHSEFNVLLSSIWRFQQGHESQYVVCVCPCVRACVSESRVWLIYIVDGNLPLKDFPLVQTIPHEIEHFVLFGGGGAWLFGFFAR